MIRKKAALLNDYFSIVFTRDNGVCPEFKRRLPSGLSLGSFDITPDIILKFVRKCKTGTSHGWHTAIISEAIYFTVITAFD